MYQTPHTPNAQAGGADPAGPSAGPALISVSLDHHGAELALLERIERRGTEITRALAAPGVSSGSVALATCNRFEAYLEAPAGPPWRGADPADLVLASIAGAADLELRQVADASTVRTGIDTAEHLFRVASGLESAIVGEGEISGQVQRALERARATGTTSRELERLFQTAARTARDVKLRTAIQSRGRSLVRLALSLASSRVADWGEARVLLIGTGAYAGATLAALRSLGARSVVVHSPSGRAETFAASRGATAVRQGGLPAALAEAEIVIACSQAQDPVLGQDLVSRTGSGRTRLLIDLGMPRNIDPGVTMLPDIELLDLDTIAVHAPEAEVGAAEEAGRIARDAAREFAAAGAEFTAVPALRAMRSHVDTVLEAEIARAGGGPEVAAALRHFAGRLLHQPTLRVRELGRRERSGELAAIAELFGGGQEQPYTR